MYGELHSWSTISSRMIWLRTAGLISRCMSYNSTAQCSTARVLYHLHVHISSMRCVSQMSGTTTRTLWLSHIITAHFINNVTILGNFWQKWCAQLLNNTECQETFLAIVSPVFLCSTRQTTPPLPAPNSLILSKSSEFSSPTVCFSVRNCSSLRRCSESRSSSFNFLVSASQLVQPLSSFLQKQQHLLTDMLTCHSSSELTMSVTLVLVKSMTIFGNPQLH